MSKALDDQQRADHITPVFDQFLTLFVDCAALCEQCAGDMEDFAAHTLSVRSEILHWNTGISFDVPSFQNPLHQQLMDLPRYHFAFFRKLVRFDVQCRTQVVLLSARPLTRLGGRDVSTHQSKLGDRRRDQDVRPLHREDSLSDPSVTFWVLDRQWHVLQDLVQSFLRFYRPSNPDTLEPRRHATMVKERLGEDAEHLRDDDESGENGRFGGRLGKHPLGSDELVVDR